MSEQKFVLPNGSRLLVEELSHIHSAAIGFWFDTGSVNESRSNGGISHFIEHMLFKGTENRTALEVARTLEDHGGSLNAFTDKENTCYHARVLDTQVGKALDLLADMILHSLFRPEDVQKEKQVVIEEIKMYEDTPDELVHDLFIAAFWPEHPLGRPVIGNEASISRISRESILRYMERYYTADNLVIAVAGKIKTRAIVEKVTDLFGGMNTRRPTLKTPPLRPRGQRTVHYKDIEQVHLCLGNRGVAVDDDDRYAVAVLDSILGGGMSSRLFQEVREKRGLVYAINTFEALYRPGGLFGVYAGTSVEHLPEVIRLVLHEFGEVKAHGFPEEEVQRAKEQLKGSLLLSLEATSNRMMRMARNELYFSRFISPTEVTEKIEAVTRADVARVARFVFDSRYLCSVVVGPLHELPDSLELAC